MGTFLSTLRRESNWGVGFAAGSRESPTKKYQISTKNLLGLHPMQPAIVSQ